MDLTYTAAEEEFRSELRSWLSANIPAEWTRPGFWESLGDDARWDPRPGTDPIVTQDDVTIAPGALARDDSAFPVVWSAAGRAA